MAIPGRLELPTYGLGNRRSIRLSYGTEHPQLTADTGALHSRAGNRSLVGIKSASDGLRSIAAPRWIEPLALIG